MTKLLVLILAVIASKGLFSTVINSLTTAATSIEAVPLELAELVDVTMMNLFADLLNELLINQARNVPS
jgi:hypothetical protein